MAAEQDNTQDSLTAVRTRLLTRFNQLLSDHDLIWGDILELETDCSGIILQQVATNQKFTMFNDMYMEINLSWPTELQAYPCFVDMLNQVRQLSLWMSQFEIRSNSALTTLTEMSTSVKEKHNTLTGLFETINNSNDLSQLEEIDLTNFQWVDPNQWPDVQALEEEWRNKNAFQSINLYVLQMEQLFNTPMTALLSELDFMFENSSSSSPDSTEGMFA